MLERHARAFIATDNDPAAVSAYRRRGREVYYGDATNPAFLKSCGLMGAAAVIVTIHTQAAIDEIVEIVRELRPDMLIVSRARDATHARHLYAIGVTDAVPETIEASLQLSEAALVGLGVPAGPGDRLHPREARRVPPRAAGGRRPGRQERDPLDPGQDAATLAATGRTPMPKTLRFMNPPTMEKPPGYTHIVEIAGDARILFFAGQLGVDTSGKFVGAPGDFKAQTVQAFENLKAALEAVGAGFEHLVKINNYLVDIERNMAAFREVRDRYIVGVHRPASTTIGVPALARPGGLFEIEAVAALA